MANLGETWHSVNLSANVRVCRRRTRSAGGAGATAALRRLRASLEELFDGPDSSTPAVSAPLGIATYRPGDSVASLLARADAEMYADKARRARGD